MRPVLRSAPLLLVLLAACAPPLTPPPPLAPLAPPPVASAAPKLDAPVPPSADDFRKTPPAAGPKAPFVAPVVLEERLPNGILVRVSPRPGLPLVAMQLVLDRGASEGRPGLGAFVSTMLLAGGTKTRPALVLADALDGLGARYGASMDMDATFVSAQCLSDKLPALLDLLADVVKNPAFDAKELERERKKRLTSLAQEADSPARVLGRRVAAALYPAGHPYASPLVGDEAAVKALSRADLVAFHRDHFAPDALTLVFAGDISKERAVAEATRVFGDLRGKAKARKVPAPPPDPARDAPRVILVDRPGASQSTVAAALPGLPRNDPDFEAMRVLNTILGGQFSSRLNLTLREKHAYTYGARSSFDTRRGVGPFTAGGAIVTDATEPAVKLLLEELTRIAKEPVSDEELADAKANLIDQLPGRFESAAATAGTVAELGIYGLPADDLAKRPERIAAVSAADVLRVAQRALVAERVRVVVVGDAAKIEAGLGRVGLGPVKRLDTPHATKPAAKK
jgi:zinc protease